MARPKLTGFGARLALGLILLSGAALAAKRTLPPAPERARVRVEGLGWLRDSSLRRTLILLLGDERGATLGANGVEDAALIVFSSLADDGYLEPKVSVDVISAGRKSSFQLDPQLEKGLPRALAATEVIFRVKRGPRFVLTSVAFDGLKALRPDQALPYFQGTGLLASLTAERAYSPAHLQRAMGNLAEELRRRGYAEATVAAGELRIDHVHGRVAARVSVQQGPLWRVRSLRYAPAGAGPLPLSLVSRTGLPWNRDWQHETEKAIRGWYYRRGYPDLSLRLKAEAAPPSGGERSVTVVAEVVPGPAVRLGRIRFTGNVGIRRRILQPLVRAKPGAPLDRTALEDGQVRISRLGAFRSVELSYDPPQGETRDAVYQLQEGKRQDVSLMLGWGSFDELRGGVEWREYNLFHAANEGTLKLVQSLKSSEGEYDYVVPELFGTSADGTAKLFGFERNDRSFLDEEYGITLGAVTPVSQLGADLSAGYTFVRLKAVHDTLFTRLTDLTHANATSVEMALTRDRRDNPLLPRHGYKVSVQVEEASRFLGGQVDFQELQFTASYHTSWTHSRWIHVGLNHSEISTFGAPEGNQLPPNVLFYPGGEDSIRGYGQGQAAPRSGTGEFVGARTMTLLNLELEQALTSRWSVVAFSDTLAAGSNPIAHRLYSVGLGFRYQTFVGPIRLEYGRNLNPRRAVLVDNQWVGGDPSGTVQFSVGFPF